MAQVNVSLPDTLKGWIDARVAQGRHSSPSDYIRDLIRRDQDSESAQKAWLQAMLDEGDASGYVAVDNPEAFLKDIISEHRERRAAA